MESGSCPIPLLASRYARSEGNDARAYEKMSRAWCLEKVWGLIRRVADSSFLFLRVVPTETDLKNRVHEACVSDIDQPGNILWGTWKYVGRMYASRHLVR